MPPRPKFTKEEIVHAALELVSEKGIDALTARDLGARLGSSARPIFTVFRNMAELQREVRRVAMERFNDYAQKAIHYTPAFKQIGMQMILFAKQEPRLFQLLFMTENSETQDLEDLFSELGEMRTTCIRIIKKDYGLSPEQAAQLFRHMWIQTFGLGVLCAAGVCRFSEEEISKMLGQTFIAMMLLIESGRWNDPPVTPVKAEKAGRLGKPVIPCNISGGKNNAED